MKNQRFCPDCGSENVEPDFRRTNVLGEMIFNQNKWVCNECGYTGIMPSGDPESFESEGDTGEEEAIKFDEVEEKDESLDPSAGIAYLKYILYFLIPLTLVYYIFLALKP